MLRLTPRGVRANAIRRGTVESSIARALDAAGPAQRSERESQPEIDRASAVLAPLYEEGGELFVVLTRRTWEMRAHSGEVSFPGGRQDDSDADLWHTALREAHEEVALDPALVAAGRELFGRWQCVKCHVVAGKLPNQEPANMAPDLAKVPERLRAAWLDQWLADPGRIAPGTRMPTNFPENPGENAYPDVLGGDQKKQIAAVRSYLLSLGPGNTGAASAGTR